MNIIVNNGDVNVDVYGKYGYMNASTGSGIYNHNFIDYAKKRY